MSEKNVFTEIRSERLGESYYYYKHPTGVRIYVYPNPRSSSVYATFGTRYGSIDDRFRLDGGEVVTTPAGVAHFLEHKLFESEDGDAFERFAPTGASANAFTSFDNTRYLFTATGNVKEALDVLLDFVQHPYFTEETVSKEQGIIGQELRMYDDDPDWRVFFNLLGALYAKHPVRIDIGGTVESIAGITPEILYQCYNAFYHPENMVFAAAGCITPEEVLEAADRLLRPSDKKVARTVDFGEPEEIVTPFTEQLMDVGIPQFQLGFKDVPEPINEKDFVLSEILLRAIASSTTPLYERLMEQGLINTSFSAEYMSVRGAQLSIFAGESSDPERVRDEILAELERVRRDGLDPELFECARRGEYASLIRGMSENDDVAGLLAGIYIDGVEPFAMIEAAANATLADAQAMLERRLRPERCALSVVRPKAKQ